MQKHKPIPELTNKQVRNFWSKVKKTRKHWFWIGSKDGKGYGKVNLYDSSFLVSRVMYFLYTGVDPNSLCVLHHCDIPSCCNPKHLFLGTIADNNKDMHNKMRHQHGENHSMTHLTERNILTIRASNETTIELAKRYNVTRHAIGLIQRGLRWPHIKGRIRSSLRQKLSGEDVIAIRKSSNTLQALANEYNVDLTTISKIQLGHLRKDIATNLIRQPRKSGRRKCH